MSTGAARLWDLLAIPDVEEISINGNRPVMLRMVDKRVVTTDPVAESQEELIAQVQFLEAFDSSREPVFSSENPYLDMQLPDGARLAAACTVTGPVVTIRRHPYRNITPDDLTEGHS